MSNNHVELEEFITPHRVEWAYGLAQQAQAERKQWFADTGMRAARARDPKLLKALEKAAEIMGKLSEAQMGQTRRESTIRFDHTKEHTESQLFREAYRLCDEGNPIYQLQWIYGAAAWMCGYCATP